MDKPTLYISGAISNAPDLNRTKFANATKQLRGLGYIVINPHEICEGIPAEEWAKGMRICIKKLMDADVLILLDDWQQSRGAQIEFTISKQLNYKTIALETFIKSIVYETEA
jgi:hypothetical protein